MSEDFGQMLDETFKTIHTGEIVEGTIIDVKPDEIILNIGYKSEGIITKNEYSNDNSIDLTQAVSVGDKLDAKVLKLNDGDGQVVLSYKRLAQDRGNKMLEEAFENGTVLKGKVIKVLDGG
ncbi:MAG TPA: 30S ribosomal protein S1, partial [Lachnospiraceae bacterium]|nr:30S ribosomal protein S1 [Lachnospiraceae bacterium]